MLVNIITDFHKSAKRDYLARMTKEKPSFMNTSRHYDFSYWDGDRKYGYGGYKKDKRWETIAKKLISFYQLKPTSRVLDVGCGKGFLIEELKKQVGCNVVGCDVSEYALSHSLESCYKSDIGTDRIFGYYDLIVSINTLHNLTLPELKNALVEIANHSIHSYISMDSYRNVEELHNLQCWALTAEQFNRPDEWEFLFREWGYSGDWEFIYFE